MPDLGRLALQAMRIFMVAALALMVVMVFGNVALRYGFNSGISISEELSRTLFVWLTFVGMVVAMVERGHLGVDSFVRRLPRRGQVAAAVFCDLMMLGCSALLVVGAWKQTLINMDNAAPVSGLPIGIFHMAALLSGIGLVIVVSAHLWRVVSGRAAQDDLVQVVESEERVPETHGEARAVTVAVFLVSLLGSMALGVPIAFALLVCGVALMLHLGTFDAQIISQNLVSGADSFQLLAIPFFLLAGEFMNAGGLSRRIVDMAMSLVGHLRGGLGYVAVIAAIVMASMSGSAVADTAAVGAMLIPMMRKAGYDVNRSSGLIAAGGIIAPVIPPSIPFIIFGVAAGISVKKLFLAGIVPGLMMAVFLIVTWWLVSRRSTLAVAPRPTPKAIAKSFVDGIWALLVPVIIIGGIKEGVFTPTEAGVVAAVYSLLVGLFVYRELKVSQLFGLFLAAGKTTAVVMFLVAAAAVSAWLITIADLPQAIIALLEPLIPHPTLLMIVIMLIVVVVGTALDLVPTILILTPVLMPLVKEAGIDPVYFGVLFIMNNAIGLITPPVGTVLNVICGVARITMDDVMRGVWPFLLAHLLLLALLTLFPSLVLVPMTWFM